MTSLTLTWVGLLLCLPACLASPSNCAVRTSFCIKGMALSPDPEYKIFVDSDSRFINKLCRSRRFYDSCIREPAFVADCSNYLERPSIMAFSWREWRRAVELACRLEPEIIKLHSCFIMAKAWVTSCQRKRIQLIAGLLTQNKDAPICRVHVDFIKCASAALKNTGCDNRAPAAALFEIITRETIRSSCHRYLASSNVQSMLGAVSIHNSNSLSGTSEKGICLRLLSNDVLSIVLVKDDNLTIISRCKYMNLTWCYEKERASPQGESLLATSIKDFCARTRQPEYHSNYGYYATLFEFIWHRCNEDLLKNFSRVIEPPEGSARQIYCSIDDEYRQCVIDMITSRRCLDNICSRFIDIIRLSQPDMCHKPTTTSSIQTTLSGAGRDNSFLDLRSRVVLLAIITITVNTHLQDDLFSPKT